VDSREEKIGLKEMRTATKGGKFAWEDENRGNKTKESIRSLPTEDWWGHAQEKIAIGGRIVSLGAHKEVAVSSGRCLQYVLG